MLKIFTYGYGNRFPGDLFLKIAEHGIDIVLDIRARPFCSWDTGWNKYQIMTHIEIAFSDKVNNSTVEYEHLQELGNNSKSLPWQPKDKHAAMVCIKKYSALDKNILLLCCEKDYNKCHRKEVAELMGNLSGREVVHL